ncbi:hypothetical protein P615_18115 [Brevibacillus laterosporus PE36]|nr:hypothetical protein P615_18115 [Brevibacillus laterosporus PE36]
MSNFSVPVHGKASFADGNAGRQLLGFFGSFGNDGVETLAV